MSATELQLGVDELKAMRDRIGLIVALVLDTDEEALDAFLRQCDEADTVGPFVDPTLWTRSRGRLALMTAHARAFARFRAAIKP